MSSFRFLVHRNLHEKLLGHEGSIHKILVSLNLKLDDICYTIGLGGSLDAMLNQVYYVFSNHIETLSCKPRTLI